MPLTHQPREAARDPTNALTWAATFASAKKMMVSW